MSKLVKIIIGILVVGLLICWFAFSGNPAAMTKEEKAYEEAYNEGYNDGYEKGYDAGHAEGYDSGYYDGQYDLTHGKT